MKEIKYILTILLFTICNHIHSQSMGMFWKYNKYLVTERVNIKVNDTIIEAEVASLQKRKNPRIDKRYFWYKQQAIKNTQGGYDGRLLNGSYKKFDPDNNLIEKGTFKYGLKNKKWYYWKKNGDLDTIIVWRKGIIKKKHDSILLKAKKWFAYKCSKLTKKEPAQSKEQKLKQSTENNNVNPKVKKAKKTNQNQNAK